MVIRNGVPEWRVSSTEPWHSFPHSTIQISWSRSPVSHRKPATTISLLSRLTWHDGWRLQFTADFINPKLAASAAGAAKQCSGGTDGVTCGRTWNTATWDGKYGPGEQMSALSVIQANLISKVAGPVTQNTGGTSKGDPSAGSQGNNPQQATDPFASDPVTNADRAGAGILTALVLTGLVSGTIWICFF